MSGALAELACLLEATARKPGNVHPYNAFPDMTYGDFVTSASIVRRHLDVELEVLAPSTPRSVGSTILAIVRDTQARVGRNTNLGIALLLTPMAFVPPGHNLTIGLEQVLSRLTIDDACEAYEAIRLAHPGGLGTAPGQDVHDEPTQNLREVMSLAADKDAIARQYADGFRDVFETGLPALAAYLGAGQTLERSLVGCHLTLMAALPDSLIGRKCGQALARESAIRAAVVLAAGWPVLEGGARAFHEFDAWLRADSNRRNPGTTADLVAAVAYAALRTGTIQLPIDWNREFDRDDPAFLGK